jgi:hypothetical protein
MSKNKTKKEGKKAAKRAKNIKRQMAGGGSRRRAKKAAHAKAFTKRADIRFAKAFNMGSQKTWEDIANMSNKRIAQVNLRSIVRQKRLPKDIQLEISKFL